mmetsp:Transcript_7527/g.11486  ORF Transcript_7527/g.11486 Transcript_7527/m.11486 type:complete len:234 (+) Transcript_7527:99-800(+)
MFSKLLRPTVLFSNNHLLAIHKPPGWSSMPTKSEPQKSILDYLVSHELGGGSRQSFLIPLHRVDQPCSGVLLLAKTSKAASRVTRVWKNHTVEKRYLCMLENNLHSTVSKDWHTFEGWISRSRTKRSVQILPNERQNTRRVFIDCRLASNGLLEVRTHLGARHMVRSLLAAQGLPLAGDLRYGAKTALPDQSVALHAHSVTLPKSLKLGTLQQKHFESPIPESWSEYFYTKIK